jgi:hypothetical protein
MTYDPAPHDKTFFMELSVSADYCMSEIILNHKVNLVFLGLPCSFS